MFRKLFTLSAAILALIIVTLVPVSNVGQKLLRIAPGASQAYAASLFDCQEILDSPFNIYTAQEAFKLANNIPLDMGTYDNLCWPYEPRGYPPTVDTCRYWYIDEILINDPIAGQAGVYFACYEYGAFLSVTMRAEGK